MADMVRVRRANVILQVNESEVDRMVDLGYDVIAEDGSVVRECIPTDIATLQKHFVESKTKISELQKQVDDLKKQVKDATSKKKSTSTEKETTTK